MKDKPDQLLVPLVQTGNHFVEAWDEWDEDNDVGTNIHLIESTFTPINALVAHDGRLRSEVVWVNPAENDDLSFAITSSSVSANPIERDAFDVGSISKYFSRLRNRFRLAEAVAAGHTAQLDHQFIVPTFLYVSDRQVAERAASWQELRNNPHLVIIGPPGAGKTTCLRRLAIELSESPERSAHVPILLPLREAIDDDLTVVGFQRWLQAQLPEIPITDMEGNLLGSKLTILLDGLDEMASPQARSRLLATVTEIVSRHPDLKVVITCRDSVYRGELGGFAHARLKPFSDAQLHEYVWNRLHDDRIRDQFVALISQETELKDELRSPLILELMLVLYRRSALLPTNYSDVLVEAVRLLIDDWDRSRGISRSREREHSPERKFRALAQAAFGSLTEDAPVFKVGDYLRWCNLDSEAEPSLQTLAEHTGLVRQLGFDSWQFSYQLFREHLASECLSRSTLPATEYLTSQGLTKWLRPLVTSITLRPHADEVVRWILDSELLTSHRKAESLIQILAQGPSLASDVQSECAVFVDREISRSISRIEHIDRPERSGFAVFLNPSQVRIGDDARHLVLLLWSAGVGKMEDGLREVVSLSAGSNPAAQVVSWAQNIERLVFSPRESDDERVLLFLGIGTSEQSG